MPRLLAALLCELVLGLSASASANRGAPQSAGPLEGAGRVALTDPVEEDVQNKLVVTYPPAGTLRRAPSG
jgi:hypothetical protein